MRRSVFAEVLGRVSSSSPLMWCSGSTPLCPDSEAVSAQCHRGDGVCRLGNRKGKWLRFEPVICYGFELTQESLSAQVMRTDVPTALVNTVVYIHMCVWHNSSGDAHVFLHRVLCPCFFLL